jgi:hypothetical protein
LSFRRKYIKVTIVQTAREQSPDYGPTKMIPKVT